MLTAVVALLLAGGPLIALLLLGWLRDRRVGRRREEIDRQIALTDAIHRELGGVAAPVVRRRGRGRWVISVPLPLDHAALVGDVVRVVREALGPARASGLEIVMTASEASARRPLPGPRRPAALRGLGREPILDRR